jgi:hypothetical protein
MKKVNLILVVICVAVTFGVLAAQGQAKREPITFALDCAGGEGRFGEAQARRERGLAFDFG